MSLLQSDVSPDVLAGVCRSLYAMTLHRDLIGAEAFPVVMDRIVDGLATELAPRG